MNRQFLEQMKTWDNKKVEEFVRAAEELADERLAEKKQDAQTRQAELASLSLADIEEELTGMNVRDNPQRYRELKQEHAAKLAASVPRPEPTTMSREDYEARVARRAEIDAEIQILVKSPSRDRKRINELSNELASLMIDPDLVVEPAKNESEVE